MVSARLLLWRWVKINAPDVEPLIAVFKDLGVCEASVEALGKFYIGEIRSKGQKDLPGSRTLD